MNNWHTSLIGKLFLIGTLANCYLSSPAQGWPSQYGGVMLQGFSWDSYAESQWTNLEAQADELSEYFSLIWVPNSAYCGSTTTQMGYSPVYWYNQLSSFGTESQLRSMINAYRSRGTGIIEDVVINHRNGVSSWTDFPAETYEGKTWQLTSADICRDDECVAAGYAATGASDSGEGWSGMRDLDHSSANVQANVISYLNFLKNDLGYAGFRYDFVKGYSPAYMALYNTAVAPTFSVGEYWDGDLTRVTSWLEKTRSAGSIQSAAFDFPLKYSLNACCNASTNWNALATAGLSANSAYRRYAVTFVDNHDTYRNTDKTASNALAANAFLLATPGTPCIFLPHWDLYKLQLKQLILARHLVGVTNESTTAVLSADRADRFALQVNGSSGAKLIIALGSGYIPTADYTSIASGTNYTLYVDRHIEAPWVSLPSGTYDGTQQVTLTALSAQGSPLVYTTDGSEPSATNGLQVADGTVVNISSTATLKVGLLAAGSVSGVTTRHYTIASFQPHQANIYVRADWPSTYFYAWDAQGELLGSWPGTLTTDTVHRYGETWYIRAFPINASTYKFNVIFNRGSNAAQTVDIDNLNADHYYMLSSSADANGKYTVSDITSTLTSISSPLTHPSVQGIYTLSGMSAGKDVKSLKRGLYIVGGRKRLLSK